MEIRVDCIDEINDDVIVGLRMYAEATSHDGSSAAIDNWLYWYHSNPFGKGMFSIAKCDGSLVGIFSLIPVETKWAGRAVPGAKGEALVVVPEHRTSVDPVTGKPLAAALMLQLKDYAFAHETEVVFSVASRDATMSNLMSGLRPVCFPYEHCSTYFSSFKMERFRNPLLQQSAGRFVALGSAACRSFGRCRVGDCGRKSFQLVSSMEDVAGNVTQEYMLIHPTQRMLQFRFRSNQHLIYRVEDADARPAYLVFSMPVPGLPTRLKYWPNVQLAPGVVAAVVRDVACRSHCAHATQLMVLLPGQDRTLIELFHRLGYLCRPQKQKVFLAHRNDPRVPEATQWGFDFAHYEFY